MNVRIAIGTVTRRIPGPSEMNGATVEIGVIVSPTLGARIHRLVLERTHGKMDVRDDTLWLDPRNRQVGFADEVINLSERIYTRPYVEEELRRFRAVGPNVQQKTGVQMEGHMLLTISGEGAENAFTLGR